ncbi:hypothetical protein [Paenibacillus polymyxa]|uniref:hypothetical protein n=1 Tax=Paenibacillus polymyxa TaxID=1406 RepID=UPI00041C8E14|nr:hypothetical protein [Paenibacillus polymyxa]
MDKKIQEIREALAAATPGDWQEEGAEIWKRGKDYQCDNRHVHICDVVNDDNRRFIANAPSYVDYLLQQIEIKDKALKEAETFVEELILAADTVPASHLDLEEIAKDGTDVINSIEAALKGEDTP